jgi:hypothetical protein
MTEILNDIYIILLLVAMYYYGYYKGKRSRKFHLSELKSPETFAYLLKHERHRHMKDICQIDKDLADAARMGIHAPEAPIGLWIEVR